MSDVASTGSLLDRLRPRTVADAAGLLLLIAGGLLVFGVIPRVPGIHTARGRDADFQAWILGGTALAVDAGYRVSRRVRQRRHTHRVRRRMRYRSAVVVGLDLGAIFHCAEVAIDDHLDVVFGVALEVTVALGAGVGDTLSSVRYWLSGAHRRIWIFS